VREAIERFNAGQTEAAANANVEAHSGMAL